MFTRRINFLVVAALIAVIAVPYNAAASIFSNISDLEESEVFGQSSVFDPVGLLVGTDINGDSFVAGSGVFISNGIDGNNAWILTAGHVTFDEPNSPWESLRFNPNADFFGNLDGLLTADLSVPFPGFTNNEAGGGTGNDIALVRLSDPIFGIDPAQRFFGPDDSLIGTEFITAGYGNPGIFGQPLGAFDGIRRGGQNRIESAGANFPQVQVEDQFFVTDFDPFFSNDALPLEHQGSMNDSGSPFFVDINGEYQIAGITNGSLTSDLSTFAIRTSLFNDFIDETISSNSTAVPEPGTMGLLTLELISGALRRRRRKA